MSSLATSCAVTLEAMTRNKPYIPSTSLYRALRLFELDTIINNRRYNSNISNYQLIFDIYSHMIYSSKEPSPSSPQALKLLSNCSEQRKVHVPGRLSSGTRQKQPLRRLQQRLAAVSNHGPRALFWRPFMRHVRVAPAARAASPTSYDPSPKGV